MRRAFGGNNGMGWGGPGAGNGGAHGGPGGEMFRTVSRVARAGMSNLQDSSSSSSSASSSARNSKRGLSLCGSKSAAVYPISVALSNSQLGFMNPSWPLSPSSSLSDDWISVNDESSSESEIESFDDCLFGSAPSSVEAHAALLSIQHALPTSSHSDLDWSEPSFYPYGYEQAICADVERVYDAFHLLQTEPSVQRMVISLSSDRAVWKAVLNNEAVRDLREAFCKDEASASESSGNEPNPSTPPTNVLSWIFNNMRAKFMDFLAGVTDLMKDLFQPPGDEYQEKVELPDGFGELVRASFMLTAIVLLVVFVTRASHA